MEEYILYIQKHFLCISIVVLYVMTCNLVGGYQCFGGSCCLRFWPWTVGNQVQDSVVSYRIRPCHVMLWCTNIYILWYFKFYDMELFFLNYIDLSFSEFFRCSHLNTWNHMKMGHATSTPTVCTVWRIPCVAGVTWTSAVIHGTSMKWRCALQVLTCNQFMAYIFLLGYYM